MIYIIPNIADISRIVFAIAKVESMTMLQSTDLPFYCAVDFRNLLMLNIIKGKYSSGYASYNYRYYVWKAMQPGVNMQFWRLYNTLLKNISMWRFRFGWMVGIPKGIPSPNTSWFNVLGNKRADGRFPRRGGNPNVGTYANWMEFGRRGQPARPLFQPTKDEYVKDGLIKQGMKSLRKIGYSWS